MGFDLKILAAPLMNRVHLVTILLGALLFGAFRFSGGEIGMKSRQSPTERQSAAPAAERAQTVRRPANIEGEGGELDAMLAKSPRLEFSSGQGAPRRPSQESVGRTPTTVRAPNRLAEDSPDLDSLVDVGSTNTNRPTAPSRGRDNGGLNDIERQLGLR